MQQLPEWPPRAGVDDDTDDLAGPFVGSAAVPRPPAAHTPSPPAGPPVVMASAAAPLDARVALEASPGELAPVLPVSPGGGWGMSGAGSRTIPSALASAVAARLPFPAVATEHAPAAVSIPDRAKVTRGLAVFGLVVILALGVVMTGYLWALPTYRETHTTIVVPDQLLGLRKVTDPLAYVRDDPLALALGSAGVAKPTVVSYVAADDPAHQVKFAGATRAVWLDVGGELDRAFARLTADLALTGTAEVDPGAMGGVARCDAGRAGAVPVTVCGWQDHGSIGLFSFTNRTPQDGAVLLRAMRLVIQHRTG